MQLITVNKRIGKMAERSNALVLKTSLLKGNGGSNPSLSAKITGSSSGRTFGFGPENGGSNPSPVTIKFWGISSAG